MVECLLHCLIWSHFHLRSVVSLVPILLIVDIRVHQLILCQFLVFCKYFGIFFQQFLNNILHALHVWPIKVSIRDLVKFVIILDIDHDFCSYSHTQVYTVALGNCWIIKIVPHALREVKLNILKVIRSIPYLEHWNFWQVNISARVDIKCFHHFEQQCLLYVSFTLAFGKLRKFEKRCLEYLAWKLPNELNFIWIVWGIFYSNFLKLTYNF